MAFLSASAAAYLPHFTFLAAICGYLQYSHIGAATSGGEESSKVQTTADFKRFQQNYLMVYLVMMAADWMQGPYVYALYQHYGFEIGDIGYLFIMGFGSSMVFGTFVGSAADQYGRKRLTIMYAVIYGLSCLTKHSSSFTILMLGRLFGGVATSILFSAFESWLICEHHAAAYPEEWLGQTFSRATFGNGIVAILAGVVATVVKDNFGIVAPFDASLVLLVVGGAMISQTWRENYGDQSVSTQTSLTNALTILRTKSEVLLVGLICSLFEGVMFVFVFMWTPALEIDGSELPHGMIFACFMVCVMIGSSLLKFLTNHMRLDKVVQLILFVSTCAFCVVFMFQDTRLRLAAFFVFEVCCGLYFPSAGMLRARLVPEEVRATLMNLFRIPLNLIVVVILTKVDYMTQVQVFSVCALLLSVALLLHQRLIDTLIANTASDKDKELSSMKASSSAASTAVTEKQDASA